ncbi:MAG TPA: hypothetical protein VMU49_09555 [Candidatus Acidoferrales bacterium]|nr:hypothetical protein [Candidatus Acidoferrales bacterium]
MSDQPPSPKRQQDRSPRYPAIDLQTALGRAVVIYKKEGRHVVPNEVAARHWELSPKSSSVLTTTAALRAYGLLADGRTAGTSGVALTDLGFRLAADERGINPDRQRLIQEAALKPTAYADAWKHYEASLPSDDLLEYYLKTEKGFTHDGARAFIRNFRSTLRFAGIGQGDNLGVDATDAIGDARTRPQGGERQADGAPPMISTTRTEVVGAEVQVPIARGEWATIVGPFPMPKPKWDKFLEMLKTMEFALVEEGTDDPKQISDSDPTS